MVALAHRVVGGTSTNAGLRISRNRLRIVQDPNAITAVRFDVMVRDFSMLGCSASSSVSGVRAGFIGFLFNDGSSTDPQDATGDIIGIVGLSRISSSTDSTGIVRAVGILARCIERTCSGQLTTFTVLDLGPVATGETVTLAMNWDRVEGNWKAFKGQVQQKWGKLTNDDLDLVQGKRTELSGRLQQRYGYAKDQAEREIDGWLKDAA